MFWLRKLIAHVALSRSDAALIRESGGEPRTVRGMVLDARIQFLENQARKRPVDWAIVTPQQVRASFEQLSLMFGGPPVSGVRIEKVYVTGRSHSVPCRLYLPQVRDNSAAMLVYFHSGGGVIGSLESCHRLCGLIAKAAGAPVLSVDYRLAPEHRYPMGLDDARAAYVWANENAARYGAPARKVGVGGDSMGGAFAAQLAVEARDGRIPQPALQLLIYPAVDAVSDTASMHDFANAFPLTEDLLQYFLRQYLPEGTDLADPKLSPLRAQSLKGLAPALVYNAGFDMLLDQGEAYGDRLTEEGVRVTRARFDSLPHAFVSIPSASPAIESALQRIAHETSVALKGQG